MNCPIVNKQRKEVLSGSRKCLNIYIAFQYTETQPIYEKVVH